VEAPVPAPVPARPTLANIREAVQTCHACDLWKPATQAVIGEGPRRARLMLVGEQPGDREDIDGHPFVGPAGHVLDRALERAGVERSDAFLTNVVKHFRYTRRGKRRIHQRPNAAEIAACRPWFDAELAIVRPRALVCMGAVAAQELIGPDVRVTRDRGRPIASDLAPLVTVTVHPSSILRAPGERRDADMELFVEDLRMVANALAGPGSRPE
jgi:uracil-DNA glycosylase